MRGWMREWAKPKKRPYSSHPGKICKILVRISRKSIHKCKSSSRLDRQTNRQTDRRYLYI